MLGECHRYLIRPTRLLTSAHAFTIYTFYPGLDTNKRNP